MTHTVVVADDDPAVLKLLSAILGMRGFAVQTAVDGADALEKVRRLKPSLLVMDVNMPKLDGLSALEELKKDPATKDIPVLIISSLPAGEVRPEAFKEGAVGYLEKPFEPAALAREIRTTLAKGGIKSEIK